MRRNNQVFGMSASIALTALLVGACAKGAKEQNGNSLSATTPKSNGQSIGLQATTENKGKRCERKVYYGVGPEATDERECYRLEKRLIDASEDGDLTQIKEALKYGANVEGTIDQKFPPVHAAAMSGHADAVVLLLDNGADVNREVDFEHDPLTMAASAGHAEVVKVLVERGANVCYRTSAGTAEDMARARGYADISELLKAARQAANCPEAKSKEIGNLGGVRLEILTFVPSGPPGLLCEFHCFRPQSSICGRSTRMSDQVRAQRRRQYLFDFIRESSTPVQTIAS